MEKAIIREFSMVFQNFTMRAGCPAFHPDAPQEIMQMGDPIFALRRDSLDGALSVICLFNFRGEETKIEEMALVKEIFLPIKQEI